jgi:hypothetical protein
MAALAAIRPFERSRWRKTSSMHVKLARSAGATGNPLYELDCIRHAGRRRWVRRSKRREVTHPKRNGGKVGRRFLYLISVSITSRIFLMRSVGTLGIPEPVIFSVTAPDFSSNPGSTA